MRGVLDVAPALLVLCLLVFMVLVGAVGDGVCAGGSGVGAW